MRQKNHSSESLNNKPAFLNNSSSQINSHSTNNNNKIPLYKKLILDSSVRNISKTNDTPVSNASTVFILPDTNVNALSSNTSGQFAPILLLPINSNMINSGQDCQRSFGCQANDQNDLIVTQEVGSQTVILNASQYQQTSVGILSMDSFKDYEQLMAKHSQNESSGNNCDQNDLNVQQSQQTQTSLNMSQQMNESGAQNTDVSNDDYYYLDAATSTSPLINLEILLNDISTQTNQQNNQIMDRSMNQLNRPKYEQSSATHSIQVNFDLLEAATVSAASANMSTSTYEDSGVLNSSMNSNASGGMSHNRCTTPSASNVYTFAACQTEDFYFDASFNATNNSTQTTKYFSYNVVETQTEWDEYL